MNEPQETQTEDRTTLTDEEIETGRIDISPEASVDDDSGDDTGDDAGDDGGDESDPTDTGDDAGDDAGDESDESDASV